MQSISLPTKAVLTAVAFAVLGAMALVAAPTAGAQQDANVGRLIAGLANVNVQNVNVEDVQVVNVEDSLNENDIRILNNALNRNEVLSNNSNFLNDLLRDAEIIDENQIVVGVNVLSGTIYVLDQ